MADVCDGTDEEWRDVAGTSGQYQVSNLGRVRSVDRVLILANGRTRAHRGKILALKPPDTYGHVSVGVSVAGPLPHGRRRHSKTRWVHQLVAEAFLGPRPDGYVVCHLDGNAQNNHINNLRWDTPSANKRDQRDHGTDWQANKVRCKWGHLLIAPNLDTNRRFAERGWRRCLACAKAHQALGPTKLRPSGVSFQEESDRRYRSIMVGQPCL